MRYEFNPKEPSTLRSHARPYDPVDFQEQLNAIGGFARDGVTALRVKWAPEVMKFQAGRMRPAYLSGYYLQHITESFRAVHVETNTTAEISAQDYAKFDWYNRQFPEKIAWAVFRDRHRESEWLPAQRWVIEQFIPENQIRDTPANWEMHRYGDWMNPDTGLVETGVDMIGPYPFDGRYEMLMMVESDEGTYRDLDRRLIEEVREPIYNRDRVTPETTAQQESDFHYNLKAKDEK